MEEDNNLLRRRRYSNAEKLSILRAINRLIGEGQLSIRAACQKMKIAPTQYRTWTTNQEQLSAWSNSKAKSCDTGPNSSLYVIEKELLKFIFELREQGIPVQISTVAVKANALMPSSWSKSRTRSDGWLDIKLCQGGLSGTVLCTEWAPMRAKNRLQKQQVWPLIT